MNTIVILSIIFAIMGFIISDLIAYRSFGSLDFWDIILLGGLGAATGALIGVLVAMVVISIVF